jgi:hypothetical protein
VECIEAGIEVLLPQLTDAFRGVDFALGSSAIAVSESYNQMLKPGPLLPTFVGIQNAHTHNHMIKDTAAQVRTSSRFRTLRFIER